MTKFTQEERDLAVKTMFIGLLNLENESRFKAGGICTMPKFKNYEEYEDYCKVMQECFPIAKSDLSFKDSPKHEIMFDIPSRYLK